jgi:hypothetical protein
VRRPAAPTDLLIFKPLRHRSALDNEPRGGPSPGSRFPRQSLCVFCVSADYRFLVDAGFPFVYYYSITLGPLLFRREVQ